MNHKRIEDLHKDLKDAIEAVYQIRAMLEHKAGSQLQVVASDTKDQGPMTVVLPLSSTHNALCVLENASIDEVVRLKKELAEELSKPITWDERLAPPPAME